MHKAPFVFPLTGIDQYIANLEALDITLSAEQILYLESIIPFDMGFLVFIDLV